MNTYTHPKEKLYFTLSAVFGCILWLLLIVGTMGTIFLMLLPMAFSYWMARKFLDAYLYGNCVQVTERQYEPIHKMLMHICQQAGIKDPPVVFVTNGQGMTNAFATKLLKKKYIIFTSDLVDLMIQSKSTKELRFILTHELAHHMKGHVRFWKNLIIGPARFVPYLGMAYSRACEYTADGVAMEMWQDYPSSVRALTYLASGSEKLATATNVDVFAQQEGQVPGFFGFLTEIMSTHPRMTRRVLHLRDIGNKLIHNPPNPQPQLQRVA